RGSDGPGDGRRDRAERVAPRGRPLARPRRPQRRCRSLRHGVVHSRRAGAPLALARHRAGLLRSARTPARAATPVAVRRRRLADRGRGIDPRRRPPATRLYRRIARQHHHRDVDRSGDGAAGHRCPSAGAQPCTSPARGGGERAAERPDAGTDRAQQDRPGAARRRRAHRMRVISVQATTAAYRLPDVGDDAGRECSSIADSSRRALTEMRGLLTILRGATDAPLVPQPTLTDVPALLDSTRQSGATITAPADLTPVLETAASRTSTATGLTAYRILQEALSNAVRHAPGAAIAVSVALTDTDLALDVDNGPPPDAPSSAPHASASRSPRPHTPDPHPPAPGAGLGLAGIRERAAALGGTIS